MAQAERWEVMTLSELLSSLGEGKVFEGAEAYALREEHRRCDLVRCCFDRKTSTLSLANFNDWRRMTDLWADILEGRQMRVDGDVTPGAMERWSELYGAPDAKLNEVRALLRERFDRGDTGIAG